MPQAFVRSLNEILDARERAASKTQSEDFFARWADLREGAIDERSLAPRRPVNP
jgi:hypothetical protein